MEYRFNESKEGLYDVFYTEEGERVVVLAGLNPEDRIEHYSIQEFIHEHYSVFSLFYWLLYVAVLTYLFSKYIAVPLYEKWFRDAPGSIPKTKL